MTTPRGGDPASGVNSDAQWSMSRRQVTVLFSDLVGSTALAEQLDPEELREIQNTYHERCTAHVARYDGTIGHVFGDGLLAYFGHPVAHEDDARRAVLAGLDILDEVTRLAPEVVRAHGAEIAVRVGIHTGLVVAGEVRTGEWPRTSDVTGATMNIAARIQAEAEPGTALLSASTYDLVRGYFDVVDEGPRQLRGVSQPVRLFRVVRPSGAESRLEAAGHTSALVDRELELEALKTLWDRAARGRGETVAVEGDPGIGKSRLVEELKHWVRAAGGRDVAAQCSPYHQNSTLYPAARMIERAAGVTDLEPAGRWPRVLDLLHTLGLDEDESTLLASLVSSPPPAERGSDLAPEQRREQLFTALVRAIHHLAEAQPLLLVAEDTQWADPSTLTLLDRIVTDPETRRVLVVMTVRTGAGTCTPETPTIRLLPLATAARLRLVDEVARDAPLPEPVRSLISNESGGNPLYIEALTRMAISEGPDAAASPTTSRPSLRTPETIQDLLMARLDQFPGQKPLAQLIATIGATAPIRLVQLVTGVDEAGLRDSLEPLVAAGILRDDDHEASSYSFTHALLREVAYQSQLHRDRRKLHLRIAALIEQRFPQLMLTEPERLADHWFEGGEPLRAAPLWYDAGRRAAAQAAHLEAVAHYRRALAALAGVAESPARAALELSLQTALGHSALALNGYTSPEAEAAYRRAFDLAAAAEQAPDLATRFGLWAFFVVVGNHAIATDLAMQCMAAAAESGRADELLQASTLVGYQHFYAGDLPLARKFLEVGASYRLPERETVTPHDPAVACLVQLAPVLWMMGDPARARRVLDDGLARAEALAFPIGPFSTAYAHTYAAWFSELASEPTVAAAHAQRAIDVATRHGFATWAGAGMLHLAIANTMLGASGEAIPALQGGIAAWRAAGAELFVPYFLFRLAEAQRGAGDLDAAQAAIDEALAEVERRNERFVEAELLRLRAEVSLELDPSKTEDAERILRRAVDVAHRQGARTSELRATTSLHRLYVGSGRAVEHEAALRALVDTFGDAALPDLADACAALGTVRTSSERGAS